MGRNAILMRNKRRDDAERKLYRLHLGCGIAAVRLRRGLTRKTLASRLRVSLNLLGCWERGVCLPTFDKGSELCQVLRVTTEDLLAAGERRAAYLLRRHEGPEISERRSEMSNETSSTVTSVETDPGVVPVEPDLKSERVQEGAVAPMPPDAPVQAG